MSSLRVDSLDSDSGYVAFPGGLDSSEATSGMGFPRGTTAQRPSGMIGGEVRLNLDTKYLEQNTGSNSSSANNLWYDSNNHTNGIVKGGLMVHYDARAAGATGYPTPEDDGGIAQRFDPKLHDDILGNWTLYSTASNAAYYNVNSQDPWATPNGKSVTLLNTSTGWIGFFVSNVQRPGRYVLEFQYVADQNSSSLVLDNDGLSDNSFNRSYTAGTTARRARRVVNVDGTGEIRHFFRRNGGGNIIVYNIRFYQDVMADLSGNYNNGGIFGDPSLQIGPGGTYSVYFDGVNDYVVFDNTFWNPRRQCSMGIWFSPYAGSLSSQRMLVDFETTGDFCLVDNGELRCHPTGSYWGDTLSTASEGVWNYAVLVQADHGWRTVYLNGVDATLQNTGTNPPYAVDYALSTRARLFNAGTYRNYFQGYFGSFHAYNRELTPEEVLHNYNAEKARYGL